MQVQLVDMHTHTSISDGTDTPAELVNKAAKLNLAAIAITDHDTLDGLDEAEDSGKKYNIEIIRGCELSVTSCYGEIHLIGLWVSKNVEKINDVFNRLYKYRVERNLYLVEKFNKLGCALQYEDVLTQSCGKIIGRLHFAQALLHKGYVSSIHEAFRKYLGCHGSAYIPKEMLKPKEAISLLVDAGAMVSFAHPMLLPCPREWLEKSIASFKNYGLSAIEAYHSDHSLQDERYCVDLATRYDLGITGGSDYHGTAKPNIFLGKGRGRTRVTVALLNALKERHRAS